MAEEHRWQAPEGHRLCANNCGFFGSPATMNLCSKCYGDYCLKEQQQTSLKASLSAPSSSSSSSSPSPSPPIDCRPPVPTLALPQLRPPGADASAVAVERPNRCSVCRKRVGLTGFRCRCGTTFCGVHRYPERHGCTFDFKRVGREEIARANPLVIAEKLEKI